jgi:hypothetical protein
VNENEGSKIIKKTQSKVTAISGITCMIRELYTLIQKANFMLSSDMLRSTLSSCSTSNLNSARKKGMCYLIGMT